jgi:hypothetical protein
MCDKKSLLIKFVGGLAFSYGLMAYIGDVGNELYAQTYRCAIDATNCHAWPGGTYYFGAYVVPHNIHLLLLMAVGLVLLTYDFSGCCKPAAPSKAKK